MDNSYDVYLTGELLTDSSETTAIAGLVELHALEESDARRLVDGKRRRVKTDCDKGAALEYRNRRQASMADISLAYAEDLIPFVPIAPKTIDTQTDHLSLVQNSSEDSRDA